MQQAVLNSLQTDFEEADGRHFAEAGIAASLAERLDDAWCGGGGCI